MRDAPRLSVEALLRFLPDLEEVRRSVAVASVAVPATPQDSSSRLSTLDKRVVEPEAARVAMDAAQAALQARLVDFFGSLRATVDALYSGDEAAAVKHLIEIGEAYERFGAHGQAQAVFERAVAASGPLREPGLQALALRRLGRSLLTTGDFVAAVAAYARSADLAAGAGDAEAEVTAWTGVGNVLLRQGRAAEAQRVYEDALQTAGRSLHSPLDLQVGQLQNNIARALIDQRDLEAADKWLIAARETWARVDSDFDRAVCWHVEAELRRGQGRLTESRSLYERVLAAPIPDALRAAISVDVAEVCAMEGRTDDAFAWARVAEEQALASKSPDYLVRIYRGIGNVARDTGAEDGITFYEKALHLARGRGLAFEEAETLVEYSRLRTRMDRWEEAVSYLDAATETYERLGADAGAARARELREAGWRGAGAAQFGREIPEAKRQAESLARAKRLESVGTLISGVGHELRNAINNILLLTDADAAAGSAAVLIAGVRREAERAARVVSGLNLVARNEADALRRAATDLNDLAAHVVRMVEARLAAEGSAVRVQMRLSHQIPAVFGDGPKIEQVLDNLLTNASHALRGVADPLITLETKTTGLGACVRVSDNGSGIPPAILGRVFDPFFTTKAPGEGTGLGLAVSHTIVDQHGGNLDVVSDLGRGSTFTVDLPADRGPMPVRVAADPLAPTARQLRLLVVDDEPIPRGHVSAFLTSRGHIVDVARDGKEALDLIDDRASWGGAYDAVISDLWMPRRTGEDLLNDLRQRGDPLASRILFVTGDSAASGATRALIGAEVIPKPYTLEEVARRIEALAA